MSEERLAALEANLRTVTDQVGRLIDQVQQKGYVPVFRCGHSGLYLPGDYVHQWGRKYGIGLGYDPVSEVLDTDYETAPPDITPAIRRIEQIMHPVGPCRAQVDMILVPPDVANNLSAVLEIEDPTMEERAAIVLQKQRKNPRSRLPVLTSKWRP